MLALLLLALARAVAAQQLVEPWALSSLVAAERAFARTSVERGVREAFLAFFADDGINFQPHPTRTREALLRRPAPAAPPPVTLDWQPIFADVSRAGDLGYTTGPYTLTDRSESTPRTRHGYYFSIWKRQPDQTWKVVLDLGTQTPAPTAPAPAFQAPLMADYRRLRPAPEPEGVSATLLKLEGDFAREVAQHGMERAYLGYLSEEARLNRDGRFPVVGREAARQFLAGRKYSLRWQPIKADISRSGELGYTYGSYELIEPAAGRPGGQTSAAPSVGEKGYYVRVWKRLPDGSWKVVFDATHALPIERN